MIRLGIFRPLPHKVLTVVRSVRKWALHEGGGVSEGMCSDSAMEIVERLKKKGIVSHYIEGMFFTDKGRQGWPHCWARHGRLILDVTGDQFNHSMRNTNLSAIVYGTKRQLQDRYCPDY